MQLAVGADTRDASKKGWSSHDGIWVMFFFVNNNRDNRFNIYIHIYIYMVGGLVAINELFSH